MVDGFDDAGRTGLEGGALDWTTLSGAWEVADGAARATAADGPGVAIASIDTGSVPASVTAKVRDISPGVGVNVRIVDAGTYWALVYLPTSEATWQLLRIAEGGVEPVVTFDGPGNPTVTAEVRMDGNDLTVLVDGVEYATVTDSREADATAVGFGTVGGAIGQSAFDDFRLSSG